MSDVRTSYFTFGFGHAHAVGGFTYDKDIVVKITAPDPRAVMFQYFGSKWCMEYHSEEEVDMSFYPRGIREIVVTGPVNEARPLYEHDCSHCTFLGRAKRQPPVHPTGAEPHPVDVYVCSQGGTMWTIVERWSDEGPDCHSGSHLLAMLSPEMREHAQRVMAEQPVPM